MSKLLLGKVTPYESQYNASLLYPIPRQQNRNDLNITAETLPFSGIDVWHAYEISWLNAKGKPQVAIGRFVFPCTSPNLVESKSLKLYLNSLNNTAFPSWENVITTLKQDLSACAGEEVEVALFTLANFKQQTHQTLQGTCLDDLDVEITEYNVNAALLKTQKDTVSETLYSNLLKSNCLVTGQPDWGAIQIQYDGAAINKASLLQYLVSFRNHNEFHEQCVERIFMDIMHQCEPQSLTVTACYTRRGGLDISPFRTTNTGLNIPLQLRCPRQ